MKKIRVMVNDILQQVGSTTVRNVIRKGYLELVPVSITHFAGSQGQTNMLVDQQKICLVEPSENINQVIKNYGRPDIVVDINPKSVFWEAIPELLTINTSFILFVQGNLKKEVKIIKRRIKSLRVNILLFTEMPSEEEVIEGIDFLRRKQLAHDFGRVFSAEVAQ